MSDTLDSRTVLEIVRAFLVAGGYDGLYSPGECGCLVDDLAPCISIQPDCIAGYRCACPADCGDHDWHIGPEKETPCR